MTVRIPAGMPLTLFIALLTCATNCETPNSGKVQAAQEGDVSPQWRIATCEQGSAYGYWSCSNIAWSSILKMNWTIFSLGSGDCCINVSNKCIVLPDRSVVISGEATERTMKFIGWGDDGGDGVCTIIVLEEDN